MFIAGLEQLTKEEKAVLLAQLQAFNSKTVINDAIQKTARKTTNIVTSVTKKVAAKLSEDMEKKIDKLQQNLDWDPNVLERAITGNLKQLSQESEADLSRMLYDEIKRLANLKNQSSPEIYANAVVHRAAKILEVDVREYLTAQALEDDVFEECVAELIHRLKKKLRNMPPEQRNELENLVQQEISKLSQADQEVMRQALKLKELSAKSLISFLKTTSGIAIAQLLLGGFGFGTFLFLTTTMKAFSLLLGFTLPFAAYTTATAILAFALSAPFLIFATALTGGIVLRKTDSKIGDEMSKILIMIGRGKLLQPTE